MGGERDVAVSGDSEREAGHDLDHVGGWGSLGDVAQAYRTYLRFNTSPINGSVVLGGGLALWNDFAWGCSPKANVLVQRLTEAVPGNNFANLTWATRPAADGENQDSSSQAFGGEWAQSGCPTAADMVWNDVSKIGQILQQWADNPASAYGLLVRAADEGNIHAYRHFGSLRQTDPNRQPRMLIGFTLPPVFAGYGSISPLDGTPSVVTSKRPTFTAPVKDPSGDAAKVALGVWVRRPDGTIIMQEGAPRAGTSANVSVTLNEDLVWGKSYEVWWIPVKWVGQDKVVAPAGKWGHSTFTMNSQPTVRSTGVQGLIDGQVAAPVVTGSVVDTNPGQKLVVEARVTAAGETFTVPMRCVDSPDCDSKNGQPVAVSGAVPVDKVVHGRRYTWGLRVKDASGVWQPSDAGHTGAAFTVKNQLAAPQVAASASPGGALNPEAWNPFDPDATYSLALTSSEAVESFTVTVDGRTATVPATGAGLTGSWTWPTPSEGSHEVTVTSRDRWGNTATTQMTLRLGNGAITAPAVDASIAGRVAITASARHDDGDTTATVRARPVGDTAWQDLGSVPVTVAGDASLVAYDWDTTTVAAGWWQVQVEYGPGRVYERRLIVQPSAAGVPGAAAVGIGPGTAFAATGEYQVGATDVTDDGYGQTLALRRVWSTRTATTPGAAGWGVFGTGWAGGFTFGGASGAHIADHSTPADDHAPGWIGVQSVDGSVEVFTRPAGRTGTYQPVAVDKATGSSVEVVDADTLRVNDADGTITTFTKDGGTWIAQKVTSPGEGRTAAAWSGDFQDHRVQAVSTGVTGGDTCATRLTTGGVAGVWDQAGCRTLVADISDGRWTQVRLRAYDPDTDAMRERVVAVYDYDNDRLTRTWNPQDRLSDAAGDLVTGYTYTDDGLLEAYQPASGLVDGHPGLAATTMAYDDTGRVITATTPRPAGDSTGGDAVARVVYDTPLSGDGLPDLTTTAATGWLGTVDAPVMRGAVAVFDPGFDPGEHPDAQAWRHATISGYDATGRNVLTAQYGADQWLVDSIVYAPLGTVGRMVSGANLALITSDTCQAAAAVCALPSIGERGVALSTQVQRDSDDPPLVTAVASAATDTVDDNGQVRATRTVSTTAYDQDAPHNAIAPDTGLPYRLPTSQSDLVVPLGAVLTGSGRLESGVELRDASVRTEATYTDYTPQEPGTASGWDLRAATIAAVPVTAGVSRTQALAGQAGTQVQTGLYDPSGNPTATSGVGTGLDSAGATDTDYYGPGATCGQARGGEAAAWAGLPCRVAMAAAPAGGSAAKVSTAVTGYTIDGAETAATSTAGGASATSATSYNAAGLPVTTTVTESGTARDGFPASVPVPATTIAYDPATGAATSVSTAAGRDATGAVGSQSVQVGYDSWGRATSSTDVHGVVTTTGYNATGQVEVVDTGQARIGIGYDSDTDFRGLPTSTTFTPSTQAAQAVLARTGGGDTVTTSWDAAAAPTTRGVTGVTSATSVDAVGHTTSLTHTADDGTLVAAYSQVFDGMGRVVEKTSTSTPTTRALGSTNPAAVESFTYDHAGRLTRVMQAGEAYLSGADTCRIRRYVFNTASNKPHTRFQLGTLTSTAKTGATCTPDSGEQLLSRTFNAASQTLTAVDSAAGTAVNQQRRGSHDTGYVYDAFGRTLFTPSADSPTGTPTGYGYYADDAIAVTVTAHPQPGPPPPAAGYRGDAQDTTTKTTIDPSQDMTWDATVFTRDPMARADQTTTFTVTTTHQPDTPAAAATAVRKALQPDNQPDTADITNHYPDPGTDAPAWTQGSDGTTTQYLPAPDGTNALTLTTSSNPAASGDASTVALVDPHGDNTVTLPATPTTRTTITPPPANNRSLTGGAASFTHYDEYGNPQTPATTPNDPKATLATFGSLYGYLATWQRPTQPTSGLTHMGARTYNPVAGTFTTADPIPDGNTNPYTYPEDPQNNADPTGLSELNCGVTSGDVHYSSTRHRFDSKIAVSCSGSPDIQMRMKISIALKYAHSDRRPLRNVGHALYYQTGYVGYTKTLLVPQRSTRKMDRRLNRQGIYAVTVHLTMTATTGVPRRIHDKWESPAYVCIAKRRNGCRTYNGLPG